LTFASISRIFPPHVAKGRVGFGDLNSLRRFQAAPFVAAFSIPCPRVRDGVGRDGRPQGLPVPQDRFANLSLARLPRLATGLRVHINLRRPAMRRPHNQFPTKEDLKLHSFDFDFSEMSVTQLFDLSRKLSDFYNDQGGEYGAVFELLSIVEERIVLRDLVEAQDFAFAILTVVNDYNEVQWAAGLAYVTSQARKIVSASAEGLDK
jgi:hypothetical protein